MRNLRQLGGAFSITTLLLTWLPAAPAQAGGTNFTTVASFGNAYNAGADPLAELTPAPDGTFFGTTYAGGANGLGTVFNLNASHALVTLFSFDGANHGANPLGPLTFGPDGNLYGTTYSGGANGLGTVFMITPSGICSNLANFSGADGAGPRGALIYNTNTGRFYGTTAYGGLGYSGSALSGNGALFTILPNSTNGAQFLASFDGTNNGARPYGGVSLGPDGNLYGTTFIGGTNNGGTIFMYGLTTGYGASLMSLYSFSGADGTNSQAGLVLGPDGQTFYGTTLSGGTYNAGTIFSISAITNSVSTVTFLWSFGGTNGSGSNCVARLLLGTDGTFYGTTEKGGAYNDAGTLFSCTTNGSVAVLYSFRGGSGGGSPRAGVVQGVDGNFYGVTATGGSSAISAGTVYELSGFAPYIIAQPTNQTILTNSSGVLNVAVGGSPPLTYHWQKNTNDLGNSSVYIGANTPALTIVSSKTASTNYYDVWVENSYGSVTSTVVEFIVADTFGTNAPTVKITSPSQSKSQTSQTTTLNVTVSGTALGDVDLTVESVSYQLNGGGWYQATLNGTKWSASVTLRAGTNVFEVYAQDTLNQFSAISTAYLVPKLFVPVAGAYSGLFLNTNEVVNATNAGFFTVSVTTAGGYSGKLQMGGASYSMSGKLDTNGVARATAKQGKSTLSVVMQFDLTTNSTDRVFGVINNGAWQANLVGDRAVFDGKYAFSPFVGRYNFTLSGTNLTLEPTNLTLAGTNFALSGVNASSQPAGGSYGTLNVSKAGKIAFAASLSDGTTFSQSVPVSKKGLWPLYASLYKGQGLIWSWQVFPANSPLNFAGDVAWIKPPVPKSKYYPNGFALRATPLGSAYTAPQTGENAFGSSITNEATLIAIEGALQNGITNPISISPKNRVGNQGTEVSKLSLSFSTAAGAFSGGFTPATGGKSVAFRGVVLANTNSTGYFLSTNQQSGQVWITMP